MRSDLAGVFPTEPEPIEPPTRPADSVSRREFLQTLAGTTGALLLPKYASTAGNSRKVWLLDCETGDYWLVGDPVSWSLKNARHPVLARAQERLLTLTPADRERIIRLVIRRCGLNLIEIHRGTVAIHHWGQRGQGDFRPFFKAQGLARSEVEVIVRDRKRERSVVRSGDDFLYGDRLTPEWLPVEWHFPLDLYLAKQKRWHRVDADDWTAAPGSRSGYGWEGVEGDRIPWVALKSIWRWANGPDCPNCDIATCWINFGRPQTGFLSRSASFISICSICRRSLRDTSIESAEDVERWLLRNLDAEFLPRYDVFCGRRTEWMPTRA